MRRSTIMLYSDCCSKKKQYPLWDPFILINNFLCNKNASLWEWPCWCIGHTKVPGWSRCSHLRSIIRQHCKAMAQKFDEHSSVERPLGIFCSKPRDNVQSFGRNTADFPGQPWCCCSKQDCWVCFARAALCSPSHRTPWPGHPSTSLLWQPLCHLAPALFELAAKLWKRSRMYLRSCIAPFAATHWICSTIYVSAYTGACFKRMVVAYFGSHENSMNM